MNGSGVARVSKDTEMCLVPCRVKGLFTPSDYATVTVTLMGGAFEDQRFRLSTLR